MPVTRLNHAVLYVRDAERSARFYQETLGFVRLTEAPGAVFMRAPGSSNDHDLGLFGVGAQAGASGAGQATVGLYHLAWEVDTLIELERLAGVLAARGSLVGATDHGATKALYAKDPDGIEFELSWLVPADLLRLVPEGHSGRERLDIGREQQRFGATTRGGVGVSMPAPSLAPAVPD